MADTHKTIAYYCVATHLGGAERSLLDLITRVEAQSVGWYRPFVILPRADGPRVASLATCNGDNRSEMKR